MSKIEVRVSNVQSTNSRIVPVSSELAYTATQLSSLRTAMDRKIAQRSNTDYRLNQAIQSMQDLERKLKEMHRLVDYSMDQYVKADSRAASFTVPGKKRSFWDQIGDGLGTVGEVLKGFGMGLVDTVVSTVEGLWNVVRHPIQTVKGLVYVVEHPIQTGEAIWQAIKNSWNKDVANGDAESASHWFGRAFGEVALAVVGTKGVDKAVKLTKGATVLEEAGGAKVVLKASEEAAAGKVVNEAVKEISAADRAKLSGWKFAPNDEKYLKYKEVYDEPKYYNQETGNINWPPNNGFAHEPVPMKITENSLIDRYGEPGGNFFAPEGTPYEQRALALHSDEANYYVYRALEDFEVMGGKAEPWFGRTGGGIQYIKYHEDGRLYTIQELIDEDFIEPVSVKKGGIHNGDE